jgi:phage-related baseplate assembly protein
VAILRREVPLRLDVDTPYALERLATLPPPALFTTDAAAWTERLTQWFEAASGRKLYPMQVEMLLIETLSYAMSVLGHEAQLTVEQHLVAFATGNGLDQLGPNRFTPRLPSAKARCRLRFSRAEAQSLPVTIVAGTRVRAGDVVFRTLTPAVMAPAALFIDIDAEAETAGEIGNGFAAGQISEIMDPVSGLSAANITVSSGGSDEELDDAYRLRLANAPYRISTGGGREWYQEETLAVSSAIIDATAVRPQPCYIELFPLTATGAASLTLRNQIAAHFNTFNKLDIRFGDQVAVLPPVAVIYAATLTVRAANATVTLRAEAAAVAAGFLTDWRLRLGAIVSPSAIEAAVRKLETVVDVEVSGLPFVRLNRDEFMMATLAVVVVDING